jgi:hypothetical protein
MVLYHIGVSHEIKLVVGKGQRLSPGIAFLVVDSVVRRYLRKSFCGRPIVRSRRVAPEPHGVYGQGAELRSDVQITE